MEEYIFDLGYSEMYEWEKIPDFCPKIGRFVSFSKENPNMINIYTKGTTLTGVTTINSKIVSDNPTRWPYKYKTNDCLDPYVYKKIIAKGIKQYDQLNEMPYIQTYKSEYYDGVINESYNPDAKYVPRNMRPEWVKVSILGKAVVEDDGKCVPGEFCSPYEGTIKEKFGIAVPASKSSKQKFYVLKRLSKNTIMILYR